MRLALVHTCAQLREYLRYPSFSIPTLLFPTMFFVFFVLPNVEGAEANGYLAGYAVFAVLGIAFFQFGVGIAVERTSPWEHYLRTLPVSVAQRFGARLLTGLIVAALAASVVIVVGLTATDASIAASRWPTFLVALLGGAIPLALLGIAIGYWTSPKGALPIANMLYLSLAFLGGLWTTPANLPSMLDQVTEVLPTRQWVEVVIAAVYGLPQAEHWAWLAGFTIVFGALAAWGYRRDEGERFD